MTTAINNAAPYGDLHAHGGRFGVTPGVFSFAAILEPWCAAKGIPTYEAIRAYYNLPDGRMMETYDGLEETRGEMHRELHVKAHPLITGSVIDAMMHADGWEDVDALADAMRNKATLQIPTSKGWVAVVVNGKWCQRSPGVLGEKQMAYWTDWVDKNYR